MSVEGEPDPRLRSYEEFELLTAELLSRFVELPSGEVDAAIESAQRRVCELLDIDLCSLWQWTGGSHRFLRMTHLYWPGERPPIPERTDAEELYPWTREEVLAGRSFICSSLGDYPPEAARDRETTRQLGVRSFARLPLSAGGGPSLGALTFATTSRERTWSPEIVRRLRLVARIFAGALARKAADEALRESEERLTLAAEAAGVGLWRLDLETSTYWATNRARRLFDIPGEEEPVTRARVLSRVLPEDRGRLDEAFRVAVESGSEASGEYRIVAPDGGVRWLSSRGRVRPGPEGKPGHLMGVTLDVTERRRSEAALQDLSRRLIRAHEEERALLARELHDDLSQRLAVLAIDVGRAELSASGAAAAETLRTVREGLVSLSEDVHSLAYQLHPSVLEELGLVEALRTECERFRSLSRADVALRLDPAVRAVGKDAALCLFRVAQEALRNVARHAGASAVTVSLRRGDGGLLLAVRDDGAGFDPAAQRERRSLGLASMRERVELVGGTLRVDSVPGEGTAISAWVPGTGAP
ncbi:MAG: PAS domain-containing protein [Thermoanaerobaculia bacterium]